jgi:ActR/RegA family two-component response regulator
VDDLVSCEDGRVQLRCVIVDDDEAFVKVAQAVLERDGVTMAGTASSCAGAVERAEALISTHAGVDYADLIAESPVAGFLPKVQLSGAAIRRILGMD